jgi:putative flippase GtrA
MGAVATRAKDTGAVECDCRLIASRARLQRLRRAGSRRNGSEGYDQDGYDSGRYKLLVRWLKFNAVGAMGVIVQLAALALLVRIIGLSVVAGTGLAVETAIVHNFAWHRGWTWADREGPGRPDRLIKALGVLFRFNISTGMVSLVGNMFLMHLLVTTTRLGLLTSNLVTIAMCSFVNFVVSDRFVFRCRD